MRESIKVQRKPITNYTDNGWSSGGWFAFPKPDERTPNLGKLKANERVLWCPYCGEWTVFRKRPKEDNHDCTGVCGWSNSDEFYVKTYNDLWWE